MKWMSFSVAMMSGTLVATDLPGRQVKFYWLLLVHIAQQFEGGRGLARSCREQKVFHARVRANAPDTGSRKPSFSMRNVARAVCTSAWGERIAVLLRVYWRIRLYPQVESPALDKFVAFRRESRFHG